ncbi:MAG TPA: hypothetical protein VLV48_08115, partial [Thermoanaerobaculia bacterium]|nr:hypothetical protein [Thermoanaerobaculia bacterium]
AFPGTCIEWGEDHFEVVRADSMGPGVRYLLVPWNDANAIRTLERYDANSERILAERRAAEERRRSRRKLSIPLALVLGDLPGAMQEEMESEYGVTASRLTLVSIIPLFIWGVFSMLSTIGRAAGAPPLSPPAVAGPGLYFFLQSLIRFGFTMSTGKPIGSFPVVFVAETIRHVSGRGRKAPPKLAPLPIEPSIVERDAYRVREPYLALLSPDDQLDFASRYGFDAILWGKRTAWPILFFSVLGIVTGISNGGLTGWISVLAAGYCAGEQIARLRRLARGLPAGSIFGIVVEPMAKRLRAPGEAAGSDGR